MFYLEKIINVAQCIYLKVRKVINRYSIINIVKKIVERNDFFHYKIHHFFNFKYFKVQNSAVHSQDMILYIKIY